MMTATAPTAPTAIAFEFTAARYRFDASYGSGPDKAGLVIDRPEAPRLTPADLQELHGDDHDGHPGNDEGTNFISEPDANYWARVAERERLDWEREREAYARELARHNAEVVGYAWSTSSA